MVNKKYLMGILVLVLVFGITVFGCDLLGEEEKFNPGTINGVWHLVDSKNVRNGTVITISNGTGTLTAIGSGDCFSYWSQKGKISVGDTVLRNIQFSSNKSNDKTKYWSCESIIRVYGGMYNTYSDPSWSNRTIYYFIGSNTLRAGDNLYVYRFKK